MERTKRWATSLLKNQDTQTGRLGPAREKIAKEFRGREGDNTTAEAPKKDAQEKPFADPSGNASRQGGGITGNPGVISFARWVSTEKKKRFASSGPTNRWEGSLIACSRLEIYISDVGPTICRDPLVIVSQKARFWTSFRFGDPPPESGSDLFLGRSLARRRSRYRAGVGYRTDAVISTKVWLPCAAHHPAFRISSSSYPDLRAMATPDWRMQQKTRTVKLHRANPTKTAIAHFLGSHQAAS